MSLVSFAIRLIVSRLLRGQTWAGSRIYNSPVDPVAEWQASGADAGGEVCIALYSGRASRAVVGKAAQGRDSTIDLIANVFVPPSVMSLGRDENGDPIVELTTTNTGAAMAMDMVGRQIDRAFQLAPAPWKPLWDKFVVSIEEIQSRPLLYEIEKTVQIPCIEITYRLKCIGDPPFGAVLPYWKELLDAMSGDADYAPLANSVEALIAGSPDVAGWRQLQATLGLSDVAARSLGITPIDDTETGEPAVLSNITLTEAN